MKHSILLLVLGLWVPVSEINSQQAQTNWELSKAESGTKSYVARDYISLKPGFSYKAVGTNTFTAKIDEYLLFPPNNATYGKPGGTPGSTTASGGVVGAIPGQFAVSPSGAATYTIPIEVPAGINGMQPNISLVYNSQSGNGIAGWGWNIGGISMISRAPKNLYFDNKISGIDWTKESPLMLDGQRLIKTGTNEYRTESETFSRITAESIQAWGPEVIKVQTKEGLIMEYGKKGSAISYSPISSTKRLGWLLSKVYDRFGNYISYNYSYGSGVTYKDLVLQSVTYGSSSSGQEKEIGKISFTYDLRTDVIEGYIDGTATSNNRLLKTIEVGSNSVTQRTYDLNYNFNDLYSQLSAVDLKTVSGEQVNSTSVRWQKNGELYSHNGSEDFAFLSHNSSERPIYGDFNGDGRRDFITYKDGLVTLYLNHDAWGMVKFIKTDEFNIYGDKPKGIIPADLNGDGKLDLIAVTDAPNGTYRYNYYFSDGQSFSNGGGSGYKGFNTTRKDNDYIIGDFDGDGRHDILIKSTFKVYNHSGSIIGSDGIPDWGQEVVKSWPYNVKLLDFTGNGKTNICVLYNNKAKVYELNGGTFQLMFETSLLNNKILYIPGDFNGDGKSDFLCLPINPNMPNSLSAYILFSTGTSFVKYDLPDYGFKTYNNYFVRDFNLDGKSDLLIAEKHANTNYYKFNIGIFNGTGFNFYLYNSTYITNTGSDPASYLDIADYTGDGRAEVCFDRYSDARFIKSFNDASHLHISEIRDGLGESVSLSLAPITSYIYSESGTIYSYPLTSSRIPLYVLENSNIYGSINKSVSYFYKDLLIHKQGKGFLGFMSLREKEYYSGIEVETTNKLNTSFNTLTPYLKEVRHGSTLVSKTQTDVSLISLGSKRFVSRLTSVKEENKLSGTTATTSYSSYDSYGNPKTISTDWGGGISETQSLVYTTAGSWCDNKVKSISTTRTNAGVNETLSASFDYYDTGKLKTHTANPGKGKFQITNSYEYDTFGNLTKETVNNNGDSRSITRTYTPSGRFLKTETNNQLKETVTYNFNEATGTLTSMVTPSGTTKYTYDGFGRITGVEYPDKNRTATARQWAGSAVSGAIYYVYEESSGTGPVKVWYDGQGRELRRDFYGLGGKATYIKTEYNSKGQLYRVSEPYFGSAPSKWAVTYSYDSYGRTNTETTQLGVTSYSYSGLKTTVTSPSGTVETTLNSAGQVLTSKENGKTVTFKYHPSGKLESATPEGGTAVSYKYDLLGYPTEVNDPNTGKITYLYNGFGEIVEQSRPIHIGKADVKTTYSYHSTTKLPATVSVNGQTTSYAYDSRNRLKSETISGVHSRTYEYDSYNRPVKVTETITGKSFVSSTVYDAYGRVAKETFPSGYFITNTYDDYGYHSSVTDSKGSKIWEAKEADAFGRLTKYNQGGRTTSMAYHAKTGLPTSIVASSIINMSYIYNGKGHLESRRDVISGQQEVFAYDGMSRLDGWTLTRPGTTSQSYNMIYDSKTGGVENKPNVGYTMNYGGSGKPPHALTSVAGVPSELKDHAPQSISYNDFSKVSSITQGNKTYNLSYGTHRQRVKSVSSESGSTKQTKYYLGNYEEEVDAGGNIRKLHYIYGSNTLAAIMEHKSGQENLYYTYTDYQGNLMAVTDAAGTVKERYAYDAWGLRKNPTNWTQTDTRTSFLFSRGYTMHEHLDDFGLINMNGRVYDPLMAQFLSPDPYIQAPGSWLNYNRYAYCYNNPLMYTDPDGEWIHLVIGAIIGGVTNWAVNGADFTWEGLGYFGVGAVAGAVGAGVGVGIQTASAGASFWAGFAGSSQGISTILSVGYSSSFLTGAAVGAGAGFSSGFLTGTGNGLIGGESFGQALGSGLEAGGWGALAGGLSGGIAGGLDAVRDGRDFWGGKTWQTATDYSLPNGNLPIHQQPNPEVGCTQETLESISDYLGKPVTVANMSQGEDFAQLANQYGFKTKTVMPATANSEHLVGAQLKIGNPSAITYNNGGTMHTVGLNRMQIQQVPRVLGSGFRTRILIQVMDPLHSTYQNLSTSLFRGGYIRVVVP